MPLKIGYQVVGSSGENEGFEAKSLELHSPTVPGWQTPKFCSFPQELVLRLNEPCKIKKLQLLSHQYMIPSKVEFYVGAHDTPESFKRLGYIYLSNNEKTGFKSRELKSVHVDAEGQYVRVLIHKSHPNKFNTYNQASIMAFNVIGDSLSNFHRNYNNQSDESKQNYISPMDDIAFDMYQDPEVAEIIRRLDKRKKEAVRDENFDLAKRMKQAIADLQKVGEKLARYELDKRRAVENEDYDLAKSKKAQMEEYRSKVYEQLQKYNLLQDAGISPRKPEQGVSPLKQSRPQQVANDYIFARKEPDSVTTVRSQNDLDETNSAESVESTVPGLDLKVITEVEESDERSTSSAKSAERYDDMVIPALNKKKQMIPEYAEFEDDFERSSPDPGRRPDHLSGPEAMSEKNIREAASAIDVFGLPLVAGAYSKTWSFREDTLLAVYKLLSELPVGTPKEELRIQLKAALFLVKRSIRDKVHSVFHASLKLLELILVDFIPRHKLAKSDVLKAVTMTLPNLILKTGETVVRSRSTALDFIDKMSGFPVVQPTQIVPQHLLPPFKRDTANRLALSRVEMVEKLLLKIGLEEPAVSVDSVMKFVIPSLEHASGAVRETSVKIVLQLYRLAGSPVKNYLPNDDAKTRKNHLYRNLFDEFDRIDGKPTQSELKQQILAENLEENRRKKQQINELQTQVNQLKVVNNKLESSSRASENKSKNSGKAKKQNGKNFF